MSNAVALGYIPGTPSVEWSIEHQCFVCWAQRMSDGGWDWYPAPIQEAADGSKVVWVGSDRTGYSWVTVEAAPPSPAPSPEQEYGIATLFPGEVANVEKAIEFVKSPKRVKTAVLCREPVHGHWYESAWMWFFWFLTAVCAYVWFFVMRVPSDGTDLGDFVHYFGWLLVGWMFLAASVIGALQKEGYRRLAAAYAIALWALITWFWNSQMKNSVNNRR